MLAMPVAEDTDGRFIPKKVLVLDGIELPLATRLPAAAPLLKPKPKRPVPVVEGVIGPLEAEAVWADRFRLAPPARVVDNDGAESAALDPASPAAIDPD